jgi:hypothetical protein
MNKETLRMQMLAGVITESEYKEKLENIDEAPLAAVAIASLPLIASIVLGTNLDKGIKNLFDKARKIKDEKKREKEITKIKQIEAEIKQETSEIKASPEYSKAQGDSELQSLIKQYNDSIKYSTIGDEQAGSAMTFGNKNKVIADKILEKVSNEYPTLKKVIEREILADLKDTQQASSTSFKLEEKDSLNEHYVAGGIVGIGAINQIPPREKANYETAFEHFLGQKYGINEEMDEVEEVEEPSLYEGEVNENIGSTIDKILQTFEFSEKGNDEMIEFANYLLSPEGPKNIAQSIKGKLKGTGGENYFTSKPKELEAFLSKLK